MNFSEKLLVIRKDKNLSQEDLAELIGVSRQAVAKWESGLGYPDIPNLVNLSNILKVSLDRLIKPDSEICSINITPTDSLNYETFLKFLCKAKVKTYAGKGNEEINPSRPNSHDLKYQEGSYLYIDTFLGGEEFAGEEGVWVDNTPIWSLNYCGRVLCDPFSGDFLKEALLQVCPENPYRGPQIYRNGDYCYHCTTNGDFNWFQGYEEIFYCNKKVYECYFHGGSIK